MGVVAFLSGDELLDRRTWPRRMTVGDKLFRLAKIAPEEYRALELIIDGVFQRKWDEYEVRARDPRR